MYNIAYLWQKTPMIPCSPPNHEPFFKSLDTQTLKHLLLETSQERSSMMQSAMIFYSTTGELTLEVDQKKHTVHKQELCVSYPYSYCSILEYSSDFTGYYLEIPLTLYKRIHSQMISPFISKIKANPCISMPDSFVLRLYHYIDLLSNKPNYSLVADREDWVYHISMSIIYELSHLFHTTLKDFNPHRASRQNALFYEFLIMLSQQYLEHRDVDYYAGQLAVTPRHLSRVVKQKTGHSCSHWIKEISIMNAKRLLLEDNNQVKDVCFAFHFPSPSFFSQYFRKETGMTPSQYQKKYGR